jgi:type VI secretion system protein ImpM
MSLPMRRLMQPLVYFGKLPSRGDFVRSHQAPALIHTLDRWLTAGVEALASDVRWKTIYDQAPPAHFLLLGTSSARGLAGHLVASSDASGRRFPFVTAVALDVPRPLPFLARSPLMLARAWTLLETSARHALAAGDAHAALGALSHATVETEAGTSAFDAKFADFLDLQTVGSLDTQLAAAGHAMNLRQLVIGLGLLLGPVLASGAARLERGLLLPLPADPLHRPLVASLWLELVAGFLARADFELALFMPRLQDGGRPVLQLGMQGAAPRTLHALFDPAVQQEAYVDACDAEWVEECIGNDAGVHKLSSYLQQPGLTLTQAVRTFKEVFLGS